MKTTNNNLHFDFIKMPEYLPEKIITEKLENLDQIMYLFYTQKSSEKYHANEAIKNDMIKYLLKQYQDILLIENDPNNLQEHKEKIQIFLKNKINIKTNNVKGILDNVNEASKNDMIKYLLKEYYNILLIESDKNKSNLQEYKEKIQIFLKDKINIKTSDVKVILEKDFPEEIHTRKDILRILFSHLNIEMKSDSIINIQDNELIVNDNLISVLLRSKITENVTKQLMQVWMLCQLNRQVGLENVFLNKEIKVNNAKNFFDKSLNYELVLKEKLYNNVNYEVFWDSFNIINQSLGINKENQKVLLHSFANELYNKTDNLFTIKSNVFYFNITNIENLLKQELNKERKKELTKLYIIHKLYKKVKSPQNLSESMTYIEQYAEKVQKKLFAQVSKNFIFGTYDEIKSYFNKTNLVDINNELGSYAADAMILKDNKNLILNVELCAKKIYQENSTEEEKMQFSLIYIVQELLKNKNLIMKFWNSEENKHENVNIIKTTGNIKESDLLKSINAIPNNKLLNTIHTFFKNIELDQLSQENLYNKIILQTLKTNILQTGKNKEKALIITKDIILFNEDKMKEKNIDIFLKLYVFYTIFKDKKNTIWLQDQSVNNIEKHIPYIIEELKNRFSEKDIYLKIKEIEKELEIQPKEDYEKFHDISKALDAKNDLSFMKNEMLIFKHEKKTALSTVFVKLNIIDKLLNKTIDSYNVKELAKLCLFTKLNEVKKGVLRNKNDNLIILNENCLELIKIIPAIVEKIHGKVLEKEIDVAINELNEQLPFDSNEDYIKRNVVYEVKRMVGIKIKSPFKHLL